MIRELVVPAVSIGISALIGLVVARGSSEGGVMASRSDKITIGLSLDTLKEARWQIDRDYFVARAGELGAEVLVQSANSDDTRQMQDVEALLSRGVKALVVVAHDSKTMAKAVDAAHRVHVPVIAYDHMIRDADVDLYVSFDNFRVGEQQARYVVDHLPNGKGRIIRIHGGPADDNAKVVKQGQDNVLKPYLERGDIKVIHEDWADDWKMENAKKITNAAMTQHGRAFDAILGANDGIAGGAVQALTEEGFAGKPIVTGQDAELPAVQRIVAGTQTMTVYKPLKVLASKAAEAALKLAKHEGLVVRAAMPNGKIDVPAILVDTVAVDKSNIEDTIVKDGFHKKADIYR
jgi:D-xylose transport system substrate-binding protein